MSHEHLISNPELAHVMALAEAPCREVARVALKEGLESTANVALEEGAHAGLRAGKKYLASLSLELSFYDQVETPDEPSFGVVTFKDFLDFAIEKDPKRTGIATRVWNSLAEAQHNQLIDLAFDVMPSAEEIEKMGPFQYEGSVTNLRFASLRDLVANVEQRVTPNSTGKVATYLGKGTGPATLAFLREFIQERVQPAQETDSRETL